MVLVGRGVNLEGLGAIWVGELEVRQRMRWAVGYTLRPGKSFVEARVRILNRTPVLNTMLCFANVAVHVNEDYQVIFPPSTQYGTFHGKREFIKWPIANSFYAGADFTNRNVEAVVKVSVIEGKTGAPTIVAVHVW